MKNNIMKFIKNLKKAYAIVKILSQLNDLRKTSLFRMLYWKTHYQSIPSKEYHTLIGNGWLISIDKEEAHVLVNSPLKQETYWSDEAHRISNLFNQ